MTFLTISGVIFLVTSITVFGGIFIGSLLEKLFNFLEKRIETNKAFCITMVVGLAIVFLFTPTILTVILKIESFAIPNEQIQD